MIIYKGKASLFFGEPPVDKSERRLLLGGNLVLSDTHLTFEIGALDRMVLKPEENFTFNTDTNTSAIGLDFIVRAEAGKQMNRLNVYLKNGYVAEFVVWGKKKWADKINESIGEM